MRATARAHSAAAKAYCPARGTVWDWRESRAEGTKKPAEEASYWEVEEVFGQPVCEINCFQARAGCPYLVFESKVRFSAKFESYRLELPIPLSLG